MGILILILILTSFHFYFWFSVFLNKIFIFFTVFELSLLPLLILILILGSQFERLSSVYYLLNFSLILGLRFLLYIFNFNFSFKFLDFSLNFNFEFLLVLILVGIVKIPTFGFHMWLPKVHVEAPILASIILARLILKGGIILVLYILNFNFKFSNLLLFWVFLLFCVFSSIILLRQSDFKCLVAYSSVLHINFCFIRLLGFTFISYFGSIFIGISHAFTSPLIFLCVYLSYNFVGTRKVLQFCSFNFGKVFQIILVLVYIFNLGFPMLGRFFSELLIFNFSFNFGNLILILILILAFGLPIIFTFQILIYSFKFSSFNFIYFDSFVCNFYNFRFLILSIFLLYSVFIL